MKLTFFLLGILLALILLNFSRPVYFNIFTHSLPYGIYVKINGTPQRDDYAATCLSVPIAQYGIAREYLAQGHCSTGTVMVLKKIKGIPGDRYVLRGRTLQINAKEYPLKDKDSRGRALKIFYPPAADVLGKGKYILLSDFVPNSWDSRYWGPVGIEFLLKPLWLFEADH